jgi:polysaccharide lyase-like protein
MGSRSLVWAASAFALFGAVACSAAGPEPVSAPPPAPSDGGTTTGILANGPADSGSPDGGSPGEAGTPESPVATNDGGSESGCGSAIVCEDFEGYPLGVPPEAGTTWSIVTPDCSGSGALAIDDSEAHSGMRSLKVTGAAGYCNHVFLGTTATATLEGMALWARFYVRLTTPLDTDHATFLAMHDDNDAGDLRMGGQDSVLMWNRESDDATLPEMSPAGTALSVAPSALAWHCLELEVDPSVPALRTWVDGALVAGLVVGSGASADADGEWVRDVSWAPRLVDARFGWESYAGESETLWFDDIAIGPSRIGCDE